MSHSNGESAKLVHAVLQLTRSSHWHTYSSVSDGPEQINTGCVRSQDSSIPDTNRGYFQTPVFQSRVSNQQASFLATSVPGHEGLLQVLSQRWANSSRKGPKRLWCEYSTALLLQNESCQRHCEWMHTAVLGKTSFTHAECEVWTSCNFHRSQTFFFWLFQLLKKHKNHSLHCIRRQRVFLAYRP